jgi:hypothetical protein
MILLASALGGCSKPAANQDTGGKPTPNVVEERVMVPGGEAPNMKMGSPEGATLGGAPGGAKGGADDQFRLKAEEGALAIEAPKDAKAGAEVLAKITVTPAGPYHINKEFPTKLTFESPAGVTLAKAQLTAGGHDKAKGDADVFDDTQLAFTVKLTPAAAGTHTITGKFKFAVCDKDTCLAKSEQISFAVVAN